MKKLLFVCLAIAASFFYSNQTSAQQVKIGHFDDQSVLQLMPGIDKVQTTLESYAKDSLKVEYDYTLSDFQRRDSMFKKDSATMPAKARDMALSDLNRVKLKLIQWQQYQDQVLQQKQEELLQPFRLKIQEAVQAIVAEQKYTMIIKSEAVSPYMQPSILDNLTIRVAMRLKLTLPKEIEDAWKRANGGGTAPAAIKPAGAAAKKAQ